MSEAIEQFKAWLQDHGAFIHPDILFEPTPSGFRIVAQKDIPPDTRVVSCPFTLAITPELSKRALNDIFHNDLARQSTDAWSERQLICSYLIVHWILDEESEPLPSALAHKPYISMLPSSEKLCTPLHFTSLEREAFRGSNLYGATLDREREWRSEWEQCRQILQIVDPSWAEAFSWERYLTAATYLSSRAFPSTLLSTSPSLQSTASSHPVLLPGVDALNHARAQPVSWLVSSSTSSTSPETPSITLVLHKPTQHGEELFNNYGPKPNSELILGYGFSLPNNPDDTIVLKIGGLPNQPQNKWEVGRGAQGAEPVWNAVLSAVCEDPEDVTVEDELQAADMLGGMAQDLFERLPQTPAHGLRPEVACMLDNYLEGQRDILQALMQFAQDKEQRGIEKAGEQGLDIVEEEDEELEAS